MSQFGNEMQVDASALFGVDGDVPQSPLTAAAQHMPMPEGAPPPPMPAVAPPQPVAAPQQQAAAMPPMNVLDADAALAAAQQALLAAQQAQAAAQAAAEAAAREAPTFTSAEERYDLERKLLALGVAFTPVGGGGLENRKGWRPRGRQPFPTIRTVPLPQILGRN
jgi:hypothetical protein